MNYSLPIILVAIGGMLLIIAVRSLRAGRLQERYALLLGALGLPFLILAIWPDAVGDLAKLLGIEYHTVLLLCVTTFFLLLNFKLLSIVSVQDRRITTLTQTVGLLMAEQEKTTIPEESHPPSSHPATSGGNDECRKPNDERMTKPESRRNHYFR